MNALFCLPVSCTPILAFIPIPSPNACKCKLGGWQESVIYTPKHVFFCVSISARTFTVILPVHGIILPGSPVLHKNITEEVVPKRHTQKGASQNDCTMICKMPRYKNFLTNLDTLACLIIVLSMTTGEIVICKRLMNCINFTLVFCRGTC